MKIDLTDSKTLISILAECKDITANDYREALTSGEAKKYLYMNYFSDVVQKSIINLCNKLDNKPKNKIKLT
jgi:hypothetical protein